MGKGNRGREIDLSGWIRGFWGLGRGIRGSCVLGRVRVNLKCRKRMSGGTRKRMNGRVRVVWGRGIEQELINQGKGNTVD